MENDTPPVIKRLYENVSEEQAYELENEIIQKHGRRFSEEKGRLFNISEWMGGNKLGKKLPWSDERRSRFHKQCKARRKYDPTYEELYDDYITRNMKREEIADKYDVSEVLVKQRLQHFGITKPKHLQYGIRRRHTCIRCTTVFETSPSVKNRKYCSRTCMNGHKGTD